MPNTPSHFDLRSQPPHPLVSPRLIQGTAWIIRRRLADGEKRIDIIRSMSRANPALVRATLAAMVDW